jgi:predicted Zn-dependent protease
MYAADLKLSNKRWQAAADLFRSALSKDSRNIVATNNAAWALHQLKDPAAVQLAEQAFGMAPQNAAVLDTYAVILNDSGNPRRAVDLLKQAVSMTPNNPDYRLHLAQSLLGAGNSEAARNELDGLLRDNPRSSAAEQARRLQASITR